MAQRQRIHEFIKERMPQEVSGRQAAIIFGQDSNNSEIENYQNEYKCKNAAQAGCASNLYKCVNDMGGCHNTTNTLECTNNPID